MNAIIDWLIFNCVEVFGAVTGILYVFLEIRQDVRLWPVGIVTSAVYLWVFFTNKLYADAGLQCYYLIISILGWYWWHKSKTSSKALEDVEAMEGNNEKEFPVSHVTPKAAFVLLVIFAISYLAVWQLLDRLTDSPVPAADAFIATLSAVATWMLARKVYEHWFLWLVINLFASILFFYRRLYPTVVLYGVYFIMAVVGLKEWRKSLKLKN